MPNIDYNLLVVQLGMSLAAVVVVVLFLRYLYHKDGVLAEERKCTTEEREKTLAVITSLVKEANETSLEVSKVTSLAIEKAAEMHFKAANAMAEAVSALREQCALSLTQFTNYGKPPKNGTAQTKKAKDYTDKSKKGG